MSNFVLVFSMVLIFLGSVLQLCRVIICHPLNIVDKKRLNKMNQGLKEFNRVYEKPFNFIFNEIKLGMSYNEVDNELQSLNIFEKPYSITNLLNGYSTWRWVSKDNLNFRLTVECSFFDNKFLCKHKTFRFYEN